jgi:hypothetical protein
MNADSADGSKILAKHLKRELLSRGQAIGQSICFEAVAQAAGYKSWHELTHLIEVEGVDDWSDEKCESALLTRAPHLNRRAIEDSLKALHQRFADWM